MFEYFRLKKAKLKYQVLLMGKLYDFVNGLTDTIDLAEKLKGVEEKDILGELIKNIKSDGE